MKKVALLSDGWKRLIIYAWADGIMDKIKDYSEDIVLHHFNCYGNWSSDELHNQGEYNLFNLPDLKEYDGIIFDGNNILDKKEFDYLTDLIIKSGVPAVSIARDIEGFYYAGIQNGKPIKDMMTHMYDVHDCRKFVFVGGPKDNYENEHRINGYKQFIEEKGLDVEDNPVFYGDYDFDTGVTFFESYIADGRTLPDVFICACDNIAAGVCAQAEEMGYKVPEDFKVTGFDNLDKAAYFRPQIATVDHHNRGKISKACMDVLIDIWEGKTPNKYTYTESKCIFAESCGCANNGLVDYREYMKGQIIYGVQQARDDERKSELESIMSKCTEFNQLYKCMGEYICQYDCEGFYVVVSNVLTEAGSRSSFTVKGYDETNMSVPYAFEDGKELKFNTVSELYEYLNKTGGRNEYLFTPMHFKQHTIGYTILKNAKFLYDNPYFYDLNNILVKDLESLYDHIKLAVVNRKLKEIYNKDQLTGIYNRVAYAELIAPEFKRYYEDGVVCAIGFVDVDKFKNINDTYGHEYGDEVLKKVAAILKERCPIDGYACRYGGDEFIIFFPYADEKKAQDVKKAINDDVAKINVKLSIGMILSSDDHGSDINEYFEVADKYMYEEKLQHKAQRTL